MHAHTLLFSFIAGQLKFLSRELVEHKQLRSQHALSLFFRNSNARAKENASTQADLLKLSAREAFLGEAGSLIENLDARDGQKERREDSA